MSRFKSNRKHQRAVQYKFELVKAQKVEKAHIRLLWASNNSKTVQKTWDRQICCIGESFQPRTGFEVALELH